METVQETVKKSKFEEVKEQRLKATMKYVQNYLEDRELLESQRVFLKRYREYMTTTGVKPQSQLQVLMRLVLISKHLKKPYSEMTTGDLGGYIS